MNTTDQNNNAFRTSQHPPWRPDTNTPAEGPQPDAGFTNRIIHGDCLQVLPTLPDASVDMVLTDPPYVVGYNDRSGRSIANDDNTGWMLPAFSEMYRVLKPNSYCVSFYGWPSIDRFFGAWREAGFRPVGHIVWVKASYASGTRHVRMQHESAYLLAKGYPVGPKEPPSDVLEWSYTGNRLHPTQKPVRGLVPLIQAFTPPGAVVLDPFAGSGSTGEAAKSCHRKYILIEKDANYHRTATQRLNDAPAPAHQREFWQNN